MAEYIEREALLAWFGDYKANDPHEYLSPQHIIDDIAEVPAADVVPVVHGRWINHLGGWVSCSECKTVGSLQWKGCPVCLARMDGVNIDG